MREALEEHYVVGDLVIIADGESAIRFIDAIDGLSNKCPDLVITDLNLPRASGFAVLEAMRNSANCKNAVTVVLSSSNQQHEIREAMRLGINRYLQKPIRLQDFLELGATFRQILEESQKNNT